ncbi:MAG: protein kinase [Kiritimatiellae bacterium]|nr:protein kinase [Kiritimatiellia bacterium]
MTDEPAAKKTCDIALGRIEAMACTKCHRTIDTAAIEPFTVFSCPHCGEQLRMPARFASFLLLAELGKGGMGAVYRAYDPTLSRSVAIKVTQKDVARDRAFVAQFLQEARALAAINSPNIVQVYSYGEEAGQPYIVMELVDGGRLDAIHAKKKFLDELQVLTVARQVVNGLSAASDAGMTHGDIKPANILFDRAGNAKVSDFGLARFAGQKPKPGEIWGTPFYVAPEVVRGASPRAPADIYSLGATLFHLLTGFPPFDGESIVDTVLLRFKEPAPDPRRYKPELTEATAKVVLRMLEADPMRRYPNYRALAGAIDEAITAVKIRRGLLKDPRAAEKSNAAKIIGIVMGGLAFLAVAGIAGWFAVQHAKEKQRIEEEKAQIERDVREGRLKVVFINGKKEYRPVDSKEPGAADPFAPAARRKPEDPFAAAAAPEAAASASAAQAADGSWTLRAVRDDSVAPKDDPLRNRNILLLRGGNKGAKAASKVYLAFDLSGVDRAEIKGARLRLTFLPPAGNQTNRKKDASYKAILWLVDGDGWNDGITWENAPANDTESAGGMAAGAEKLMAKKLPVRPSGGETFDFPGSRLAEAIAATKSPRITFVVTADEESDHKGGWSIVSTEGGKDYEPPTLVLSTK